MTTNEKKLFESGLYFFGKLTPIQKMLLKDDHRIIVNAGGRRSRKTLLNSYKIFMKAMEVEGNYFQAAPTQTQAMSIFYKSLYRKGKITGTIAKTIESMHNAYIEFVNGSTIHIIGLDKPQRIEGRPWDGCHITEIPDIKDGAWEENIRPVLSDTNGFAYLDGVPDYKHPHYKDLCEYAAGGELPEPQPLYGGYSENPNDNEWAFYTWLSSDVLAESEINKLKSSYSKLIYQQEFEGRFITQGGRVYYAYTDKNYTKETYNPHRETYLCYDFNVNPMTVVMVQEMPQQGDGQERYTAVKEFVIYDSNTLRTSHTVDKFLKENHHQATLSITGDYSGIGRHASGSATNYSIIEDVFRNYHGYNRKISHIKSISNRVDSLNYMFEDYTGNIRLFVNPEQCPYLHKDLLRQVRKENATAGFLNDEGGKIGHRSDALSYFAYNYHFIGANKRNFASY